MRNWNTTGKIKAVFIAVCALVNLIMPALVQPQIGLVPTILIPLLFGSLSIPLITKSVGESQIVRPTWNDNPLMIKNPLFLFHFGAFFFTTIGVSVIIGAWIKYKALSHIGLMSLSYGVGIFIGIYLTLLSQKKK